MGRHGGREPLRVRDRVHDVRFNKQTLLSGAGECEQLVGGRFPVTRFAGVRLCCYYVEEGQAGPAKLFFFFF